MYKINKTYSGIMLTVAHKKFASIDLDSIKENSKSVVFDLKGFFPKNQIESRL